MKPKARLDTYKENWADVEHTLEDIDLDDYSCNCNSLTILNKVKGNELLIICR